MNLKHLAPKAGMRMFYAFSLSTIFLTTISSCQKDSVEPTNASGSNAAIGNTSFSTASGTAYATSAPITMIGSKNLTISGVSITAGSKPAICLTNCSGIHITKSKLMNGNGVNAVGIQLTNCTNITVDNCYITNVASGVYAVGGSGIVVNLNQMKNMVGPYPRGQFVQFNGVTGAGNQITNNMCENISGSSNPEDAISTYKTSGTSSSPVMISGNDIRGGGPSKTGGGIMLGDAGGNYITAQNNTLVNPGPVWHSDIGRLKYENIE